MYNVIKDRPTIIQYCQENGFLLSYLELFLDDLFLQLKQEAALPGKPSGNEIRREKMWLHTVISIASICDKIGYFHSSHWKM